MTFWNATAQKFPAIAGMTAAQAMPADAKRVAFVDYGKGICIALVVMMHSTLGTGADMGGEGWLHHAIHFSKPFRMPDFFLIAGLFLARTIDRPWRSYLDRKVIHFAWFYLLWAGIFTALQLAKDGQSAGHTGLEAFAWLLVEPPGTLWFIYLLPLFFLATRLLRSVPWPAVLIAAAALETARIDSGGTIAIEFARRFIYFYAGYAFAPCVFALAEKVRARVGWSLLLLAGWALANALAVYTPAASLVPGTGAIPVAELPGISLILGFAGAAAVVAIAALLARFDAIPLLRFMGTRSLHIYLAFFIFMAASRILLVKSGLITDIGTVSLLVTLAGIGGPLILAAILLRTPLRFLFRRPGWARLEQPA